MRLVNFILIEINYFVLLIYSNNLTEKEENRGFLRKQYYSKKKMITKEIAIHLVNINKNLTSKLMGTVLKEKLQLNRRHLSHRQVLHVLASHTIQECTLIKKLDVQSIICASWIVKKVSSVVLEHSSIKKFSLVIMLLMSTVTAHQISILPMKN